MRHPLDADVEAFGRLAEAAGIVRAGGVAIYPTETVYGLGGDARRPDVAARARAVKGRGAVPMLTITDRWARVQAWVADDERALGERLTALPGVTVLLRASAEAPRHLVGPEGWVGLRRTHGGPAEALVQAADVPLLSTSANPSGTPPPTREADLDAALVRRVDAVLPVARPMGGAPSTVVRPEDGALRVIRHGAVPAESVCHATGLAVR